MSAPSVEVLPLLAEALGYPGPDAEAIARRCRAALPASAEVEAFAAWVAAAAPEAREEVLYARTFDLHPPHCLDVGYQLFGESYKRGAFLVKVQAAAQEAGVDRGAELADHLTVLLRLLPRLEPARARSLVDEAVLPALAKILGAFGGATGAPHAPYQRLLEAILALLREAYAVEVIRPVPMEPLAPSPALFQLGTPPPANRHDEPSGGTRP